MTNARHNKMAKRKRTTTSSQPAKRARVTVRKLAKKVNKISRAIEKKGIVIAATGSMSPDFAPLNAFPFSEGGGDSNRVGEKITPSSLHIRARVTANGMGVAHQYYRVLVVRDKQQVLSTAPTMTQIFGSAVGPEVDMFHLSSRERWDVLYDKSGVLSPQAAGSVYPASKLLDFWVKVSGKSIHYEGSLFSNVKKNGVWIIFKCDSTSGANPPAYNMQYLPRFIDL